MSAKRWVLHTNKTGEQLEEERLERAWAAFEDDVCCLLENCPKSGTTDISNQDLDDEQCDAAFEQLETLFGKGSVREHPIFGKFVITHREHNETQNKTL